MDKKKIIVICLCMCVLLTCLYIKNIKDKKIEENDSMKFKEEYESLNEKENESTGKEYLKVSIKENNPIKYATYSEIKNIITSGTGVIYFGFPECPWCRNAVPVLLEAAEDNGIDKVYYFNALDIRDKKHLDENGNIVVDDEGTKEYKELVELLYDYLDVYSGLNDDTIKRLYFPTVIFVKNGKIIGSHSGTVASQTDPSIALNESEHNELKKIYTDYMKTISSNLCTDSHEKC